MTDQELLRAYAKKRDPELFGSFMARHEASLVRFATELVLDPTAAQEMVETAFLLAARRPGRFARETSCRDALLSHVWRLGVEWLHRQNAGNQGGSVGGVSIAAPVKLAGAASRRRAPSKPKKRRRADVVRKEIGALEPRHRAIVLLKMLEGKSYHEIAKITGVPVTGVGLLLHHALRTLSEGTRNRGETSR